MEQSTTIEIAAPPERVWEVMGDVERWSEWTDTVTWVRRLDDGRTFLASRLRLLDRLRQQRMPEAEAPGGYHPS